MSASLVGSEMCIRDRGMRCARASGPRCTGSTGRGSSSAACACTRRPTTRRRTGWEWKSRQ
eukprot:11820249-Alexandrium_andersonii.AAC.1